MRRIAINNEVLSSLRESSSSGDNRLGASATGCSHQASQIDLEFPLSSSVEDPVILSEILSRKISNDWSFLQSTSPDLSLVSFVVTEYQKDMMSFQQIFLSFGA
ncbi:hypothetical protein Tco_0191545 [Tanacetum coccineum]